MNNNSTGEPRLAALGSWAVLNASFGLSFSSWVALAVLAGYRGTATLTWPWEITLHQSWLLPIAADGYLVVALVTWLAPNVKPKVAAFARANSYFAAIVGTAVQGAFHGLTVWSETSSLWRSGMALVVGALAPLLAALAVHMRALHRQTADEPIQAPAVVPSPVVVASLVPPPVALPEPVIQAVIPEPTLQPEPIAVPPSMPLPRPELAPLPRQAPHPVRAPGRRSAAERLADRVQVLSRPAA